ncbi:SurA N-terminal domain-containing protein [Thalassotalea sp. PS06]|uniref:SurA N-terminal domain-containing protein n=1 Tax=Thalassotalea sp. PS06 TaxID=2594005 RepID=UPI001165A943|nr:SurA N-terminal domain-containing protein [Thalassotalea sp. PS06]QDP01825.1 peptidylprolyl isomerase [Thalassotalea sp. PS06]
MLERIREGSKGVTAKVILGLVIATFVFAGVGSYTQSVDTSLATVNGEEISQQAFQEAYRVQRNRLQNQFGEMFATLEANDAYMANLRESVLEQLIDEELLDQNAEQLKMRIGDAQIKQLIVDMPEFQLDGQFDNARFQALIQQSGFYDASSFSRYLNERRVRQQLVESISATEFALPYQQELAVKLLNQTRDIRYAVLSTEGMKQGIDVTDQEVEEFYQANQGRFATPEMIKLEYVELNIEDLANDISVTEEQAAEYYEENKSSYTKQERRRVAHILIEFGEDKAAAQAKAEEVLAKAKAGDDFAALALEYSADTFSAENGGDLDWQTQGSMDEASMGDALFAVTSESPVADLVETDYGFHIIKMTDIEEQQIKPFEEAKEEILATIKNDQALERFYEQQSTMGELSFEISDSLADVAEALNTEVKTTDWLTRSGNLPPFNAPDVMSIAFSAELKDEGLNSEVIEVAPEQQALVIRVADYQDADTKPLSEVRAEINQQLIQEKATEIARNKADELVDIIKAGESAEAGLSALNAEFVEHAALSRRDATVEGAIVQSAFSLPQPQESALSAGSVELANGDYAVLQIVAVNEGAVDEMDANLAQQQQMMLAQSAFATYLEQLKANAEVVRRLSKADPGLF